MVMIMPMIRATARRHLSSLGSVAVCTLLFGSTALFGLTGCGQKGALVLPKQDSQSMVATEPTSTAYPQDAAFERVDDDAYRRARYLEQQALLAEIEADPNDY